MTVTTDITSTCYALFEVLLLLYIHNKSVYVVKWKHELKINKVIYF